MEEKTLYTKEECAALFELPLMDLLLKAQIIHRENFPANAIQVSTLVSIKTGGCPEDCAYCPQSAHYNTQLEREKLMMVDDVLAKAKEAKDSGASRFCMGAAWRHLGKREMDSMKEMVVKVKELGLETCMTLGMLTQDQANELGSAGLDYYNHNLDSSPEYYEKIITTRTYKDRLQTIENVRGAGINVCSGGIIGMGEGRIDRIGLLLQLANMPEPPESVPINMLIAVEGTPLAGTPKLDPIEFVRTIGVTRILMPKTMVRLSAGREDMSEETQALCFMAGANSIFYGEKLLTCKNPDENHDRQLFKKLGLVPLIPEALQTEATENV